MRPTLIESGGVKLVDLEAALRNSPETTSFGDGSGHWTSVRSLATALGTAPSQGGVRYGLTALAESGRARRHPSGADYWQAIR